MTELITTHAGMYNTNPDRRKYAKGKGKGMKAKLGSGARFKALKGKLSGQPGVYNPAGLAASIGRKKYGAKKMAGLAAKGRKKNMPGMSMHMEVNCSQQGRKQAMAMKDMGM